MSNGYPGPGVQDFNQMPFVERVFDDPFTQKPFWKQFLMTLSTENPFGNGF